MEQFCARWDCNKEATYDKPLCCEHWQEWEAWELDECSRCHYYYSDGEFISYDYAEDEVVEGYPVMCNACMDLTLEEDGKERIWPLFQVEKRPPIPHADIKRPVRYVYILKLSDGTFYVGQTNDLRIRLQEHRDGQQSQTRGKDPNMVHIESFEGMRKEVDKRETELTLLNTSNQGRRKLRQIIEEFRAPLRLLDLEI